MLRKNRGFTLIEIAVVMAILGILGYIVTQNVSTDKSKATALNEFTSSVGNALIMMSQETGCYPKALSAVSDQEMVIGADKSWCGSDLSKKWSGPYVKERITEDSTRNGIVYSGMSAETVATLERFPGKLGNMNVYNYFIKVTNVPGSVARHFLIICNGNDAQQNQTGDTTKKTCSAGDTPDTNGDTSGMTTVWRLVEQQRY